MIYLNIMLLMLPTPPAAAVDMQPVYSLTLLGGQYFFSSSRGALTGNFSALAAPGMRFNEYWELFPSVSSSYQGTKQVVDLVGAGTLFQEQLDNRLAVKTVYTPDDTRWKIKSSLGYKAHWLKETRDEHWSRDLFDSTRMDANLETEFIYKDPFSVRGGLTYFMTSFPNYSSLESMAAFDFQGQTLARELVGDKVLNANGQMLTLTGNFPYQGAAFEFGYTLLRQDYPRQHLVNAAGNLVSPLREDLAHMFDAGVKLPMETALSAKTVLSFDIGYTQNTSNQNNYDALRTQFQSGYYDYSEYRFSPGAAVVTGDRDRPTTWGLNAVISMRSYPHRLIQNSTGLYLGEELATTSWLLAGSVSRILLPRVKLLAQCQYGSSRSNQQFQQFYKYSYTAISYLFGVSYDF